MRFDVFDTESASTIPKVKRVDDIYVDAASDPQATVAVVLIFQWISAQGLTLRGKNILISCLISPLEEAIHLGRLHKQGSNIVRPDVDCTGTDLRWQPQELVGTIASPEVGLVF